MITVLSTVFVLIAVLLVLVVLVQRGRGGGLSGAFGSGGGASAAFGTKTGDVFTTLTVILFAVFMLLAIWLNFKFRDPVAVAKAPEATTKPAGLDLDAPASIPAMPTTTLPSTDSLTNGPITQPASAPSTQPR